MRDFNWICPHCDRAVTITENRTTTNRHTLWQENADGRRSLISTFIICPNPDCRKFTLTADLRESQSAQGTEILGQTLQSWNLVPSSSARSFPSYIPRTILGDYQEACYIRDLSPKASATLSRRCLQGVVRDFWQVKPGRLVDEIDQIKDRVDPLTWGAIDALRKLGNIGAHMEKDINLIVDVDPQEAELLIGLIETLFKEWYVGREERKARMGALVAAASAKKA
ncbi:DUF4145 domain-containing protein [Aeromonas mytilicola subsp. aquatica]|uniref:DUF4145 domain-containing protein n=1 Tax=Aeromonas mytilicola TaxID=3377113 RepID=UPI0037C0F30D